MPRYRVNLEVAGMTQTRMVRESSAHMAAHRARHVVVSEGWSAADIGSVTSENEEDGHDYWATRKSPLAPEETQG